MREATAGVFRGQVFKPVVLAGAAGIVALAQGLVWALLPGPTWGLHLVLLALMLLSLGGLYLFAGRHYEGLAVANFRRFAGQPAQVRLDEEAYHYRASWGEGKIPWPLLDSLWCLPGVWVLLQHAEKGVSVLLPAASLDEEARAFIRGRVAAHGGRVLG